MIFLWVRRKQAIRLTSFCMRSLKQMMRSAPAPPLPIARGGAGEEEEKGRVLAHSSWPGTLASRALCMLIMLSVGFMFGVLLETHMPQPYLAPNVLEANSIPFSSPSPAASAPKIDEIFHLEHCLELALAAGRTHTAHHNMSDSQLLWLSSMIPMRQGVAPLPRTPKVAFLFLSRGPLPLAPLWDRFFKGNEGLYSIYVHTHPSFMLDVPPSSVFYGRQVPSEDVKWGDITMLDAERRLIANALLDFSNERFVLLSETCIPLYNFSVVYNHLVYSNHSFVESVDEVGPYGRGRYNGYMAPLVTLDNWRKGSQWFEVNRKLAIYIVSDTLYYPIFREYCTDTCYVDEHYLPTMLSMELGSQIANRSLTWVDWSSRDAHPFTFQESDISEEFITRIQNMDTFSTNTINGSISFLFARKFSSSTLDPLLQLASSVMGIKDT